MATLIDIQAKDQQTIANLYKRKLLKKNYVLTFADFTGTTEADIEDMFEPVFYFQLVNTEFQSVLQKPITEAGLSKLPRIITRLDAYFAKNPMKNSTRFSHYRPARYLAEHAGALKSRISKTTLDRFEAAFKQLNSLL